MPDNFAGYHEFINEENISAGDHFVVFRIGVDWYWQKMSAAKMPRGMVNGPFPSGEGAYLSAIED